VGIGAGLEPGVIEIVGGLLAASEIIECPLAFLQEIGSSNDLVIANRLRNTMGASAMFPTA